MKLKNLFHLGILFLMVVAILFFGEYEYVKAQNWTTLRPYNFLWPVGTPTFSPMNLFDSLSTPTLASLNTVSSVKQSADLWGIPPIPVFGYNDLSYTRGAYGSMNAMDWQQGINMGTPRPIPPSYPTEYGYKMFGPQPESPDFPEFNNGAFGPGSEFMKDWQEIDWNPYAHPGRFAPARIRNTLFEFTKQIPEQDLYPLPGDWRPQRGDGGGGGWLSMGLGGGWTTVGSSAGIGGGWAPYGGIGAYQGY